jgi:hypothetical protein
MAKISTYSKDDYIELGNVINLGNSGSDPKGILPSILDLQSSARKGAFIIQAKMFSDLSDSVQMAEYNQILGDEVNYYILEDKTEWAEEMTAPGMSKKVCKCFLKFYKFDQMLYEKNLTDLLKKHDLSLDDVEEEDAGIILNNKTEAVNDATESIVIKKKPVRKSPDISV